MEHGEKGEQRSLRDSEEARLSQDSERGWALAGMGHDLTSLLWPSDHRPSKVKVKVGDRRENSCTQRLAEDSG